jgi:hypothetical protein
LPQLLPVLAREVKRITLAARSAIREKPQHGFGSSAVEIGPAYGA